MLPVTAKPVLALRHDWVPVRDGTAGLKLAAHDHRWFRINDKT